MSKRLIIAIDCDDVLIETTRFLVNAYNNQFGTQVTLARAHESGNDEWATDDMRLVLQRLTDLQNSDEYGQLKPISEAVRSVQSLASHHELHLVTARSASAEAVTHAMLDTYLPHCFTSIEHVGNDRPKGEVCKQLNADILIDDNVKNLLSALEYGLPNSGAIHFGDYAWNKLTDIQHEDIIQCDNWSEVKREITKIAGQ